MGVWLYPTLCRELEKSFWVKKYGKELYFPKSIIEGKEKYQFEHGSKGGHNHYYEERYKFLMPEWYIKKNKILHWDNIHMANGKTWQSHLDEKYDNHTPSPHKLQGDITKNKQ